MHSPLSHPLIHAESPGKDISFELDDLVPLEEEENVITIKENYWIENKEKTKRNLVYSLAINTLDLRTEVEKNISDIFDFSRAL